MIFLIGMGGLCLLAGVSLWVRWGKRIQMEWIPYVEAELARIDQDESEQFARLLSNGCAVPSRFFEPFDQRRAAQRAKVSERHWARRR